MARIEIFIGIHLVSLWVLFMFESNKYGQADACRSLEFTPPHDGHVLVNHVKRNITVDRQDSCRVSCYLDDYCLSYNFGRLKDGHFVCQLSDSDHIQHPEDLKKIDGFVYLGTENACSKNNCSSHGKCAINPTDNTYYCKCKPGFVGTFCEKQVIYKPCSEAPKETGIYNMTLGIEHFLVYCDQTSDGGGWTMIFKVVANVAPVYIADLWNSSNTHSENATVALDNTTAHLGHYKNRIVLANNWRTFNPREARVVLYPAGEQVRFLKFDAIGTNNMNWFSQRQLINSSWTDLKTYKASAFRYFDIYGHRNVNRSFEISTKYTDCIYDGGWLVITSTSSESHCNWPKRNNVSSIICSANTTKANFNHYGEVGLADVLAVFVR